MKNLFAAVLAVVLHAVMSPAALAAGSADACIDNFCIGAPIKAFRQDWVIDTGSHTNAEWFAKYAASHPVCKATRFNVVMRSNEGRRVTVNFAALSGPKGGHFRVIGLSLMLAGGFTIEQARQVYEDKKVPGMVLAPQVSKGRLYGTTKDSVNLLVDLNAEDMTVRYDFPLGDNQAQLTKQAGCLSEVPKF